MTRVLSRYAFENYEEMNNILNILKNQSGYDDLFFSLLMKGSEILEESYLNKDNLKEPIFIDLLFTSKNTCLLQLIYLKRLIKDKENNEMSLNSLNFTNNYSIDDRIKYLLKSISFSLNLIRAQEEKLFEHEPPMYSNIEKLFIDDDYFTINEIEFQNFSNLQQVNKIFRLNLKLDLDHQ